MNQDSFLKELGRSYIVSAFFPSAFFVTIGILLFRGFLPASTVKHITSTTLSEWGGQWLISGILMLWVAFFLYSANDMTVKLFEGYIMPGFLATFLRDKFQSRWFQKSKAEYQKYLIFRNERDERIRLGRPITAKFRKEYYAVYQRTRGLLQEHEIRGPFELANVLPTRLGNVLRASEIYSNERYFIEELTIWPRLFPLMPADFTKILEEKNNALMFLLNSALLALVNAGLSFFLVLIGLPCGFFSSSSLCQLIETKRGFFQIGFDYLNPLGFLIIGIFFATFGYMLYRVGVNVAVEMSYYIRAAFDLYREDLLRQLNWRLPPTIEDERDLWEKICLFYSTGEKLVEPDFPPYHYYEKDPTETKKPVDTGNPNSFSS